jgi:tetratricopeptide (TPR) repeat protein
MPSNAISPERRRWLAALLLIGLTAVAYLPALRGGFVWDDDASVTQNSFVRSPTGLRQFWFTTKTPDYWPVTSSVFWVEWRLWGAHAPGYHAVNLALHVAESLLIWRILRRMGVPGGYLAALLFALHPVNVESVAWIAELKNLMAMLFFLLSILCFLRSGWPGQARAGQPSAPELRRGWYGFSLLAFALAMLSKGSVATLPAILLGMIAWNRRPTAKDCIRLSPFFLVAGIGALVDVWFQRHQMGSAEFVRNAGFLERLLGAGAVVWFYLSKALLPLNLAFVYPQWHVRPGEWLWWIPLLAAIGATGVLLRSAPLAPPPGRGPAVSGAPPQPTWARAALFAWGYFCLTLLPVMGFTDVYFMRYSLVADHYAHLAIIGVVSMAAAVWAEGGSAPARPMPRGSRLRLVGAGIVICVLGALTWRQCRMYESAETLYRTTLARNPGAWMARNNLGVVFAAAGRSSDAIGQYREALRLNPDDAEAHYNLALALAKLPGRSDEVIAEYEQTLRINPDNAEARNNLGVMYSTAGRSADAIAQYREALRAFPGYAEAHNNLANELAKSPASLPEAIAHYRQALRINPDYAKAHNNLGVVFAAIRRPAEAIDQFRQALRTNPDYAVAHENIANELAKIPGSGPEAIAHYEEALRIDPDYTEAHYNLATELAGMPGRSSEAIFQYEQALRTNPGHAEAHNNLGILLAANGRLADAIAHYEEALRINPKYIAARNNLAVALARTPGRLPEAADQLERVLKLDPGNASARRNLEKVRAMLKP